MKEKWFRTTTLPRNKISLPVLNSNLMTDFSKHILRKINFYNRKKKYSKIDRIKIFNPEGENCFRVVNWVNIILNF